MQLYRVPYCGRHFVRLGDARDPIRKLARHFVPLQRPVGRGNGYRNAIYNFFRILNSRSRTKEMTRCSRWLEDKIVDKFEEIGV